jgi:hypothetical protein
VNTDNLYKFCSQEEFDDILSLFYPIEKKKQPLELRNKYLHKTKEILNNDIKLWNIEVNELQKNSK